MRLFSTLSVRWIPLNPRDDFKARCFLQRRPKPKEIFLICDKSTFIGYDSCYGAVTFFRRTRPLDRLALVRFLLFGRCWYRNNRLHPPSIMSSFLSTFTDRNSGYEAASRNNYGGPIEITRRFLHWLYSLYRI